MGFGDMGRITVAFGFLDQITVYGLGAFLGGDETLDVLEGDPTLSFERFVFEDAPRVVVVGHGVDRGFLVRLSESGAVGTIALVLASNPTAAQARQFLSLGAGCLSREASLREVRSAIHFIANVGQPAVWLAGVRLVRTYPPEAPALTPREVEVLKQLSKGRTNKQIAGRLRLSARTVEGHTARIQGKLGLRKRELVGLVVPEGL